MANKRPPLSFPELEPRGRNAILRTAEEVEVEMASLENQHTSTPASHKAVIPVSRNNGMPDSQNAVMPESRIDGVLASRRGGDRGLYSKGTYRLCPEAIEAMEDTKSILRRQYQVKVSFEEIAEEAILAAYRDLLEMRHASFLVRRLAGMPESRNSRNAR